MRVGNNYTGARWAFSQRSRPRYRVDWTDDAYPEIVRADDADLTFAEAKAEVISYFQNRRDHARSMIAHTRSLKAGDVNAA